MRPAGEIRKQILRIRDQNELPYAVICERSRCSRDELLAALRLEAREETLIRLDAFLDAPKLHERKKETRLLYQIEELDRELYREYKVTSPPPRMVQKWSDDKQRRHLNSLHFKAKCELVKRLYAETKLKFRIPDGQTYWQFKVKCLQRAQALRPGDGNTHGFSGPRPIRAESRL